MTTQITRKAFDALPVAEKATAAKTMRIVDPVKSVAPDGTRLVHFDTNGERRVYTRTEFDALPAREKARIGAALAVERAS